MPTNQLDVFLEYRCGEYFEWWETRTTQMLVDEVNQKNGIRSFLSIHKRAETIVSRREPAYVLYQVWPDLGRASLGFYASFTPKMDSSHNSTRLCLEGLMTHSSLQFLEEVGLGPERERSYHPVDVLRRAYKYLHADLGFMDYETTEEDMHRIIMPYDSYGHLQVIGTPVSDLPFTVEIEGLKLVPFNIKVAERFLKPTAEHHQEQ